MIVVRKRMLNSRRAKRWMKDLKFSQQHSKRDSHMAVFNDRFSNTEENSEIHWQKDHIADLLANLKKKKKPRLPVTGCIFPVSPFWSRCAIKNLRFSFKLVFFFMIHSIIPSLKITFLMFLLEKPQKEGGKELPKNWWIFNCLLEQLVPFVDSSKNQELLSRQHLFFEKIHIFHVLGNLSISVALDANLSVFVESCFWCKRVKVWPLDFYQWAKIGLRKRTRTAEDFPAIIKSYGNIERLVLWETKPEMERNVSFQRKVSIS